MTCFGKYPAGSSSCRRCEYHLACRYYTSTEKHIVRREHIVSFEAAQGLPECADFDHIPGEEKTVDRKDEMISALSRFFRYLLDLDDYSIGIIAEVVSSGEKIKHCTIPYLGKLHGCSRQAMNGKVMRLITAHPELTALFRDTLYKLSNARQSFLRRRAAAAAAE